ncbi:hypothetical protein [Polaromonas sp. CG9_12]|nr:hypothetical protein [Polaromonas sp. CG9_12]
MHTGKGGGALKDGRHGQSLKRGDQAGISTQAMRPAPQNPLPGGIFSNQSKEKCHLRTISMCLML